MTIFTTLIRLFTVPLLLASISVTAAAKLNKNTYKHPIFPVYTAIAQQNKQAIRELCDNRTINPTELLQSLPLLWRITVININKIKRTYPSSYLNNPFYQRLIQSREDRASTIELLLKKGADPEKHCPSFREQTQAYPRLQKILARHDAAKNIKLPNINKKQITFSASTTVVNNK